MQRRVQSKTQRGFVLISLVALLVMGALYFLVSNLTPEFMQTYRQRQTDAALAQAREALLGYALRFREANPNGANIPIYMYGFLPLPDLGTSRNNNVSCTTEGCDAANFTGNATNVTVIGRFPWRMLGTGPLRDSNSECLWYAVSGSHQRIQQTTSMNWDTLGQLDLVVANGTTAMQSALATAHDRPIAIIFSPGPPLPGQDRRTSATTDDVTECGGNYDVKNYLDPATATALGGVTNYLAGTNNATGITGDTDPGNDPDTPKALSAQGIINRQNDGRLWPGQCPTSASCAIAANDKGLALTGDMLFGTLRKSSLFRLDINAMLDRLTGCLRDQLSITSAHPLPSASCYDDSQDPQNYFSNYKDQLFVAPCAGNCAVTIDGTAPATVCPAVLIFSSQRNKVSQIRLTAANKADPNNYLEAPNANSFITAGATYAGISTFSRVTTPASEYQDIVRCIPAGASFSSVESTTLTGLGFNQLSSYDATTRTLTLGSLNVTTSAVGAANAAALFGCSWTPETHTTGSGLRSYFKFNISNTGPPGPGFTFAVVDGDRNTISACGEASQHLGYSGNNGSTPFIAAPKIGVEFDTRRNYRSHPPFLPDGFDPSRTLSATAMRTLDNGRADPSYTGGHIGLVYWGSNSPISTGYACRTGCRSPSVCDTADNLCKLPMEEDDNVHGQLPTPPAMRPPPSNPPVPASLANPPPYPPPGVSKLDPNLRSTPTNQDIHVRVEIERTGYAGRDDNSRLVKVVATTPITLSGLPTIDSLALSAGDTVLVTAQTDARTNGVYLASTGAWTRDLSADEGIDLPPGTAWFVKAGAANMGSLWRLQNSDTPVINSDALTIQRVRLPVKTVATSPITLAGLSTVGGVALAAGDRVLVTKQNTMPPTPSANGVYIASSGVWSRATPENTADGMKAGAMWFVSAGSNANTYWHLDSDATPDTSTNITIQPATLNDLYSAIVQTQVWMLPESATSANQIARMKTTTRAMAQLDPVVRYGQCTGSCPAFNPSGQYCGGVETDSHRYCYTGQQPNLYDRQKIYDERGNTCTSGIACSSGQFCGIDQACYRPALRTLRLGFTTSQDSNDQVISITNFFSTGLP
ncbi:MAG: hypothetical protein EPO43_08265 [Rugosibacter sp.]|nr:MAG: hypothetical protein EPO43_08265 [Rugosibacter sp.]